MAFRRRFAAIIYKFSHFSLLYPRVTDRGPAALRSMQSTLAVSSFPVLVVS